VSNHEVYEDSYENGEGDFVNTYCEEGIYNTDTWKEAVDKHLHLFDLNHTQCEILEGTLFTGCLVDNYNNPPSGQEVEEWRMGKCTLYTNNISITVQELVDIELK